jgi:hypothetical protein
METWIRILMGKHSIRTPVLDPHRDLGTKTASRSAERMWIRETAFKSKVRLEKIVSYYCTLLTSHALVTPHTLFCYFLPPPHLPKSFSLLTFPWSSLFVTLLCSSFFHLSHLASHPSCVTSIRFRYSHGKTLYIIPICQKLTFFYNILKKLIFFFFSLFRLARLAVASLWTISG